MQNSSAVGRLKAFFGSDLNPKRFMLPGSWCGCTAALIVSYEKYRSNDRKISTQHIATLLREFGHPVPCWGMLDVFGSFFNNIQHDATFRNKVAKRAQHVAPNNIATRCVDMLRSFGRGLVSKFRPRVTANQRHDRDLCNVASQYRIFVDRTEDFSRPMENKVGARFTRFLC